MEPEKLSKLRIEQETRATIGGRRFKRVLFVIIALVLLAAVAYAREPGRVFCGGVPGADHRRNLGIPFANHRGLQCQRVRGGAASGFGSVQRDGAA